MVIHDIATSCRELLSSTTLPDDLPTTLKQLLQVCVHIWCALNEGHNYYVGFTELNIVSALALFTQSCCCLYFASIAAASGCGYTK